MLWRLTVNTVSQVGIAVLMLSYLLQCSINMSHTFHEYWTIYGADLMLYHNQPAAWNSFPGHLHRNTDTLTSNAT